MTTRKALAAATLVAIPLVTGGLRAAPHPAAADAAHEQRVAEPRSGPRWAYLAGFDARTSAKIGFVIAFETMSSYWGMTGAL